jgi:hypothetical protein
MYVPDHSIRDKLIFDEFVSVLKNRYIFIYYDRLKINSKKIYLYLKDGTPVYTHLDIPM